MRSILTALTLWWIGCLAAPAQTIPVPESSQATQALSIINAYQDSHQKTPAEKLYVVYFTPSDRAPAAKYEPRLTAIMKDIQSFYRNGMVRAGFGPETFPLELDTNDNLIIHLVKGKAPANGYTKPDGEKVFNECEPVLKAAGISLDHATVLIFCNLADWNEKAKTFSHHSPYYGLWNQSDDLCFSMGSSRLSGLCFVVDSTILNLDYLTNESPVLQDDEYGEMSLGKFNSIFLGGIAHELGHALTLFHCGERWDQKSFGTSIMGFGNHTYHDERRGEDKGSFLTMASALHLAGRPLFNGFDKNMDEEPQLQQCDLTLSTNAISAKFAGRRGALRVEGTVVGSPPVYGVIAYFDSLRDGGYYAPTATSVPDARGHFAIEVSDLAACKDGELRIEFCHANGTISRRRLGFAIDTDGQADLSQWEERQALEPLAVAIANNQPDAAQTALQKLEAGNEPESVKIIGRKLVGTLDPAPKPSPADVPDGTTQFFLGDAKAESAKVGWLQPTSNRIPPNDQIASPLLDSGRLYATGLYAHAPSSYIFNLNGKWKQLSGEAGLHTFAQSLGAVMFIVKADGREVFRSAVIQGEDKAKYKINVTDVKQLELLVEPARDNNYGDWGLWLDPVLSR